MRVQRSERVLDNGERGRREPAGGHGDQARRADDSAARGALALPPPRTRRGLRCDHLEPGHPRQRGVRAGLHVECLRTRRSNRRAALEGQHQGTERRPERRLGLRLAALRRNRHDGLRARRGERQAPLVAATRRPARAVHRDRAGRRPRPGVRQHPGLPAGRPRQAVRAVGRDGQGRLALPDDQAAVVASSVERRRRRLESDERRRATATCTQGSRTRARGVGRGHTRTAACSPGVRCTPIRSSCSTERRAVFSGTTR